MSEMPLDVPEEMRDERSSSWASPFALSSLSPSPSLSPARPLVTVTSSSSSLASSSPTSETVSPQKPLECSVASLAFDRGWSLVPAGGTGSASAAVGRYGRNGRVGGEASGARKVGNMCMECSRMQY